MSAPEPQSLPADPEALRVLAESRDVRPSVRVAARLALKAGTAARKAEAREALGVPAK